MTDSAVLDVAVNDYTERHRPRARRELEYFSRVLRSDEDAVERAAVPLVRESVVRFTTWASRERGALPLRVSVPRVALRRPVKKRRCDTARIEGESAGPA